MHKGWIIFNGKSSEDFGIVIEEVPNFSRPIRKFDLYEVPGRSGTIIEQYDAYENIDKTYKIWFSDTYYKNAFTPKMASEISSWLYNSNGYVKLEDNFEPEFYRLAYFNGPLDIQSLLLKYGKCTITFSCKPERYLKNGEKWVDNPTNLKNNFNFNAKPLIKIEGSGNVNFNIQGQIVNINNLTDYLFIDCESMDVYRQTAENKNSLMSGDFPVLKPGNNTISKSSGITNIYIKPNYWTL